MSDLVERLRQSSNLFANGSAIQTNLRAAADRIEALTEAAQTALHVPSTGDGAAAESMRVILRRALEAK